MEKQATFTPPTISLKIAKELKEILEREFEVWQPQNQWECKRIRTDHTLEYQDDDGNIIYFQDDMAEESWKAEDDEDENQIKFKGDDGQWWEAKYDEKGREIMWRGQGEGEGKAKLDRRIIVREYDENGKMTILYDFCLIDLHDLLGYNDGPVLDWDGKLQ